MEEDFMKKLSIVFIILFSALLLCSCGQQPTEEPTEAPTVEKIPTYQIKVVDIDGEILGEKDIAYNENTSVFDDLINNFDVDYTIDNTSSLMALFYKVMKLYQELIIK